MSKRELALKFSEELLNISRRMRNAFSDSIAREWEVASVIQGAEILSEDMLLLADVYEKKEPRA